MASKQEQQPIEYFRCRSLLATCLLLLICSCGPKYNHVVVLDDKLHPKLDGLTIGSIQLKANHLDSLPAEQNNSNQKNDIKPEKVISLYRKFLIHNFEKNGIEFQPGKNKLTVNVTILGYKEGNAFLRWLSPAGGDSRIIVEVTVLDDERLIGGVESQQTIAWGGAYSIGGWQKVISWSAQDVAKRICDNLYLQVNGTSNCKPQKN